MKFYLAETGKFLALLLAGIVWLMFFVALGSLVR